MVLVVLGAVLVDLGDLAHDLILRQGVDLHRLLQAERRVGMDEHANHIRPPLEHKVCTAPNEHARPLIRQLTDDLGLIIEQCVIPQIRLGRIARQRELALIPAFQACQQVGLEPLVGKQHGVDAAVLGCHGDDLTVVIRDTQPVGQHLADRLAARAILAGDGDDIRLHTQSPLYSPRYAFLIASSLSRSAALPDLTILPVSST